MRRSFISFLCTTKQDSLGFLVLQVGGFFSRPLCGLAPSRIRNCLQETLPVERVEWLGNSRMFPVAHVIPGFVKDALIRACISLCTALVTQVNNSQKEQEKKHTACMVDKFGKPSVRYRCIRNTNIRRVRLIEFCSIDSQASCLIYIHNNTAFSMADTRTKKRGFCLDSASDFSQTYSSSLLRIEKCISAQSICAKRVRNVRLSVTRSTNERLDGGRLTVKIW